MPVRDTFPYNARWDSVGLDCSYCRHFSGPVSWPDSGRVSCCRLHQLSLATELGPKGFKKGEWFCRDFAPTAPPPPPGIIARVFGRSEARPSAAALRHLDEMRDHLQPDVLYGFYGGDGNLKECPFAQLRGQC